jgi:Protein of unknown function (DUF1631)
MSSKNPIPPDLDTLLNGDWQQCQSLLMHCYPQHNSDDRKAIDEQRVVIMLRQQPPQHPQALIEYIQSQLESVETISASAFALLRFVDQLFENYTRNSKLHPQISATLNNFRSVAAINLLEAQRPWLNSNAATNIFGLIAEQTTGWQPELGRAAQRFYTDFHHLIQAVAKSDIDNTVDLSQAIQALAAFFDKEQQRVRRLEKRLIDTETGALLAKHAQQLSARSLNQQMAGKKLPTAIIRFLQGPWRESMRLLIISEGKDSDPWRKILRLSETLIWCLQPIAAEDAERRQHVYQSITEITDQLKDATVGLHHSSKLEDEIFTVEGELLKVLKGQPLDYANFDLIDSTNPLISTQASISNVLLAKAAAFEPSQWFIHFNGEQQNRIKLTAKLGEAQQLLFSNFLGMKAGQYSFDEFAYLLSTKVIVPITTKDPFKATAEKMLTTLYNRYLQQQDHIASEREKQLAAEKELRLARQQAREKALQEAKEFAILQQQARQQAAQHDKEKRQRQQQQQQLDNISDQLKRFQLDGRVVFQHDDNKKLLCKLAAVIQSTGDYIFVDQSGVKRYTLSRQQLADRLMQGSAKIIDHGSNFENTLEQVVNNLRTRK